MADGRHPQSEHCRNNKEAPLLRITLMDKVARLGVVGLLVALLVLDVLQVFGHLALDALRHSAHIGEQSVQDVELFRQLLHALLQPLVVPYQQFDFLFRLSRAQLRLFAGLPHGDVVPLATPPVLVRPLVGPLASARPAGPSAADSAPFGRRRFAHRRGNTFDRSGTVDVTRAQEFVVVVVVATVAAAG